MKCARLEHSCPEAGITSGAVTIFDVLNADDCTLTADAQEKLQDYEATY